MFPKSSNQTLKRMVEAGRVMVDRRRARKLSELAPAGAEVRVGDRPAAPKAVAFNPSPLAIVFEDRDLLVVYKPHGLLTSTVPREKRPTALAIVRAYVAATDVKARAGLIHRLDRDAAGLLVFSKSADAYQSLKTQFFKHTVERVYEAVVRGNPKPRAGRIESRLVELPDGSVRSSLRPDGGDVAVTHYETITTKPGRAMMRVRLETGRKHQIRVHLSERGWPVVNDGVYSTKPGDGPLRLVAVRLVIDHPRTGNRAAFDLPGTLRAETLGQGL